MGIFLCIFLQGGLNTTSKQVNSWKKSFYDLNLSLSKRWRSTTRMPLYVVFTDHIHEFLWYSAAWNNFLTISQNHFVKSILPFSLARISQIIPMNKEGLLRIGYSKEGRRVRNYCANLLNSYCSLELESLAHSPIHPTNNNWTPDIIYKALFY